MASDTRAPALTSAGRKAAPDREALLAQAEQLADVGSWEIDVEANEVTWSAHFKSMLGLPAREEPVPYDHRLDVIHPDDRERAMRDAQAVYVEGTPLENELRFLTATRGVRIFHSRAIAIRDRGGRIVRIRGMSQDVTEQREAEEKLREREAMLAHAEEIANLGSWKYDCVTKRSTLSPNLLHIFGAPPGVEWTAESYWAHVHPEDRDRVQAHHDQCIAEGKPFEYEARFLTPDGRALLIYVRGLTTYDSRGTPLRRIGVVQDLTKRREADEKTRGREAMLAHAEEIANLGSFQYDLATRKAILSTNLRKIFGLRDGEEWNREACWERVHPQDRDRARESMAQGAESGKPFEFVMRFTPPGGVMRHLQLRGSPEADSGGKVTRLIGIVQDITEQYEVELKMCEREALLEQAEEIANLGSWKLEFETGKVTLSPQLRRVYGMEPHEECTTDSYWARVHPSDRDRVRALLERATEERKTFECVTRFVTPGGNVRHIQLRAVPVVDAAGKLVRRVGVARDISDEVHAEQDLRRLSRQLMRTRDDERRHIARALHETVGQSLAAMKMTLGRLRDTMPEADDLPRALLQSATELADSAVREVRTVSYLMHPPMLDEAGLAPALRWYARGFAERSGIRVLTDIPEHLPRQSQETETTIFRIVQEALTNVHRYSGSRTALIRIQCDNGHIHAEVRDEGCGIAFPIRHFGSAESLGVGIAGMRERVTQLNGAFELESTAGKGTTVRIILPTKPHAAVAPSGTPAESDMAVYQKRRTKSHGA